ncbi:hypothetical protein JoomaDRAFT_0807 [Galbibacter orientalis DSM 19592]|uniref:Uncharacterized protein n=1 Tax=Galbibacter orientalis DSM 19592 TaxID=926559 RepID=I3C2J5_9FLAO|nr:hypothetical protein [Galbibacter orientalis]EIJ37838.1 hypothetical protein JoomaDRAFT_0807 [Galbibacter orientalis DSM 19592]
MKEFKSYNKNTQKNIIELYVINCKLKETYNECQYYISPSELKIFYEESFFTKNDFCLDMYDSFMNKQKLALVKAHTQVSVYISILALNLLIVKDGSAYLFKKALALEERNAFVIAALIKEEVSESLKEDMSQRFKTQEKRITTLRSIIKNHYKVVH